MPIVVKVPMDEEYKRKQYISDDRNREESELAKRDIEEVERADRIYFSYYIGSYEGGGDALLLFNGKRGWLDLGHCSCYGPMEYAGENLCEDTIEDALASSNFSEGMKEFILKDWK